MVVNQTHLIAALVLLVIVAGYLIQDKANDSQRKKDQDANVTLCVEEVSRAAYIANGFQELALRVGSRDNPGDKRSSGNYKAVADSVRNTFPGDPKSGVKVVRVETQDGNVRFHLDDESSKEISEGCRQIYK